MVLRFPNLNWLLLLAVVAAASVQAQDANSAGEPISFSSPAKGDAGSDGSLDPKSPDVSGLPDSLRAPKSLNSDDNSAPPAFVPTKVSPAQVNRLKTIQDDRKNWALLTPEEILGVHAPQNTLNNTKSDAAGQDEKSSAVDRYNQRQKQAQTLGTSDSANDSGHQTDAGAINSEVGRLGNSGSIFDQPVIAPETAVLGAQNYDSSWSKLFGSSQQPSGPDPAQLAAMNRFKQLLQPSQPAPIKTSSGNSTSASPYAPRDDHFGREDANSSINTYTPLASGIVTASGVTSLGAAQNNSQPAPPPAWAPKPPPWLSKTPQPFVIPQQKF